MSVGVDRTKLFQPDGNGPDDKLVVEAYRDGNRTDKAELYHYRGDGSLAGLVEIITGVQFRKGTLANDGIVFDWSWVHYHAAGDRTRHDHRVRCVSEDSTLVLIHEERAGEILGTGRRPEHDWEERDRWRVTDCGVGDGGERDR